MRPSFGGLLNKQNIERYETPNIETNANNLTTITVSSPTTSTHQIADVVTRPQTPAVVEEFKKYAESKQLKEQVKPELLKG